MELSDFSGVIFDMDGLVLDTESTYAIAWQQAASRMGYALSDDFCLSFTGLHYHDIEARLLTCLGDDFDLLTFKRISGGCWRDYVYGHGINIRYGFQILLDLIRENNIPYCLATNSRTANALECLKLAGIEGVFSMIVSRDHVRCGKPEPDIFFEAAERLQVDIGRCLVIEDSHAGILAAYRAGAVSALIPSTVRIDPEALELCDVMAADLAQLAERLG